jgi:membrane protease YdiL (CAAX protease family)
MDDQSSPPPQNLIVPAVIFEGLLGLAAIGLGGLLGYPPGPLIQWTLPGVGWGMLASLPLLVLLGLMVRFPIGPLRRLLRVVEEQLAPLFRQATVLELAILSLVAGLGEEALFRGVIQEMVADGVGGPAGIWVGLAVASLLFGLAHFITVSYMVMATVMGLYLGWLWIVSGNLLVPIAAHAVYDFLALVYLAKLRSRSSGGP